jgi:hypothetical protein
MAALILTAGVAGDVVGRKKVCQAGLAFAALGGLFAAFITGTVVLAGLHLAAGGFGTLIPYAVAFGGFIAGAVLGGILVGRASSAVPGTLRALAGEFTVLGLAVIAYTWTPTGFVDTTSSGTMVYEERTGSGTGAQEVHPGISG